MARGGTARSSRTGFGRYFTTRMKDPSFAAEYRRERWETDAVDALVRSLDAARESAGLTKASLATRANMKPEQVRRLFTAKSSNPTVATLVKLASALNCTVEVTPRAALRSRPTLTRRVGRTVRR